MKIFRDILYDTKYEFTTFDSNKVCNMGGDVLSSILVIELVDSSPSQLQMV